jgi:hypothetical protein
MVFDERSCEIFRLTIIRRSFFANDDDDDDEDEDEFWI